LSSLRYLLDSSVCLGMLCLSGFLKAWNIYMMQPVESSESAVILRKPVKSWPFLKSYLLTLESADPTRISWSETSMEVTLSFDSSNVCSNHKKTKTGLKFNFLKKKCYYLKLHSIGLLLSHFLDLSMYQKTIFCK
jgi:hypothetical protein